MAYMDSNGQVNNPTPGMMGSSGPGSIGGAALAAGSGGMSEFLPMLMSLFQGQGGGGGGAGGSGMGSGFQNPLTTLLAGIFGNSGKPYENAFKDYNQYAQQGMQYQMPFYNAGVNALGPLQGMLGKMSDPSGFVNNLMGNYQESPWAKFATGQAQQGANNSASASGLVGSTPFMQASADYSKGIASQDMNTWLSHALGVNQEALGGYQNLVGTGQNSANQLSNIMSMIARQASGSAYGSKAGDESDFANILKSIFG